MTASACSGDDVDLVVSKARPTPLVPGRRRGSTEVLLTSTAQPYPDVLETGSREVLAKARRKEYHPVLGAYCVSGCARDVTSVFSLTRQIIPVGGDDFSI